VEQSRISPGSPASPVRWLRSRSRSPRAAPGVGPAPAWSGCWCSRGFFSMLLGQVLFLTSVWHYSTLAAGLAITPAPLVVALLSRTSGRLAGRIGYGPVLVVGGVTFAAGLLFYAAVLGVEPHYLTQWLPGSLLVGLGVAFTFPVLSAASVAGLPQERFGVGGAMNQTARQVGAVLGVAILIAIIGTPINAEAALAHFHTAWIVGALAVLASAAVSAFQRRSAAASAADRSFALVPAEAA
jgi:MFS family permease